MSEKAEMPRYVVLIAYRPQDWDDADAAERDAYLLAHQAFEEYVDAHGERLSSAALCDADIATTVKPGGGGAQSVVTDGPFVELVEQVGGYYDVRLPDLDAAIAAASLLHPQYTVEIRPVLQIEGFSAA